MYDHLIDTHENRCVKCHLTVAEIVGDDQGCTRDTVEADFPLARRHLVSTGPSDSTTKKEPSHGADPDRPKVRDRS